MPIHFAGSRRPARSPVARCLSLIWPPRAANDNGRALADDSLLKATLAHFAAHGLGAAQEACRLAAEALRAGDDAGHHHWLAVCRTLDRRMAQRARRR